LEPGHFFVGFVNMLLLHKKESSSEFFLKFQVYK
jgi:hypothetical protein